MLICFILSKGFDIPLEIIQKAVVAFDVQLTKDIYAVMEGNCKTLSRAISTLSRWR